jgi:probable F420-dependent oxidoreductase
VIGLAGRRLGFGAGGAVPDLSVTKAVELAQSADELGYDIFTLSDHLHSRRATVEPWTVLSAVAATTRRIAVGTNVLALPYRPPAVLAKMAETLDRLSAGRLVLGLGGGGYDTEFVAFGLAQRGPRAKVDALREAIEILRGLWQEDSADFDGEHFHVRDASIAPKPEHHIPIWLGSYGPRSLALTGALADGWVPSLGRIGLAEARRMRSAVRAAAIAAGRDPDEVTCACNVNVRIDPAGVPSPQLVTGSVPTVVDQLVEIVGAGFTELLIGSGSVAEQEQLARDVFPEVRERAVRLGLADAPLPEAAHGTSR